MRSSSRKEAPGSARRKPSPQQGPEPETGYDLTSGKTVGALVNGLSILRHLAKTDDPIGVNQLARDLALNPSTCFNLLKTLVAERLVEFSEADKSYRLGYGLAAMARGQLERDHLITQARPVFETLVSAHPVTATLWRPHGEDRLILVSRVDHGGAISVHMAVGRKIPIYIAALGRCFAANTSISRTELRNAFSKMRWQKAPSFDRYMQDVELARKKLVAVDQDNFWKGVTAVAAPVFNSSGCVVAGVSAVGFSSQFSPSALASLVRDVRAIGQELSETGRHVV